MYPRIFSYSCWLTWLSMLLSSTALDEEEGRCASCAVNDSDNVSLAELRALRIEYVKSQILQKLGMMAPPQVTKPVLPDILLNGQLLGMSGSQVDQKEEEHPSFSRDEFDGRTKEFVVFSDSTVIDNCCTKNETNQNSCFQFQLSQNITMGSVEFADLWVRTLGNENNNSASSNLSYTLLEVTPDPTDEESCRFVAHEDTTTSPGWLKFEVGPVVRSWTKNANMTHVLAISCTGCDTEISTPVAVDDGRKPFIIVHVNLWRRVSRSKREVKTCTDGMTICCREPFRFSFVEIEWDVWIHSPLDYEGYFCRGSCMMNINTFRNYHTLVKNEYLVRNIQNHSTMNLCCTSNSMKSLNVIYTDSDKNTIITTLPNIIVESCHCA